jgi:hypothetical protein
MASPGEPPPSARLPPGPDEQPGTPPDPQPPAARRTTAWAGTRTVLTLAVSIGLATAVALVPLIVRAGAWRLPLAIVGGVLLLAGCVFVFPRLLAPPRVPEDLSGVPELSAKDRIQLADDRSRLQNDVRTALLQAVAGGAVLVGVLFTWQQQQATLRQQEATSRQLTNQLTLTRQGQVGERFSRAVGQLGDASIDVRLGGLYELEQLARQAPERRLVIIEVLAAYTRQRARPATNVARGVRSLQQDVVAALTILGRRSIQNGDPQVDLTRTSFAGVDLGRMVLRDVDLSDANLHGANLRAASLENATLRLADLRGAFLDEADLREADLRGALLLADLRLANLTDADLRGTILGGDLRYATLVHADLRGADLRSADLVGASLGEASASGSTKWPVGFDWRRAGVKQQK